MSHKEGGRRSLDSFLSSRWTPTVLLLLVFLALSTSTWGQEIECSNDSSEGKSDYTCQVPAEDPKKEDPTPTPAPGSDELVRLNCYFEEDRRVVFIKKSDTYQNLIDLLERQYSADNLVVKYQDEGDLFDIKSQDNLYAALQSKGASKSLNLFIWSKQRKTITLYLDDKLEKKGSSVPLWAPVLISALGFVALLLTAVLSAGPTGIEGIRRMGTPQELSHADWLHIFTTKSSKYLPVLAESAIYFLGCWLTLLLCDIEPSSIQLHGLLEKGVLPYLIGIVYGVVGAFAMHKLRGQDPANSENNSNTTNNNTTNTTEGEGTVNKDSGGGGGDSDRKENQTGGDTTNNNNNSNENLNDTSKLDMATRIKLATCSSVYEASLIILTLGLYIPACFALTDSILLSAISAQLISIASREFMEGIVTIGIGLWVYLFVSYYAYVPGILFYPSTLAWVVINILAPTKPRYDLIALMYWMESLPCAIAAAVSWVFFEVAFLNTKLRPLGM